MDVLERVVLREGRCQGWRYKFGNQHLDGILNHGVYEIIKGECLCAELRPTLGDSLDYSLPGSSVHGIPQARTLVWAAMPSSRVSSHPGIDHVSLTFLDH